VEKEAAVKCR